MTRLRLSTFVSLTLMSVGGLASLRHLSTQQRPRARDKYISVVVDWDDVQAVSIRAGVPLGELLPKLKASGATHCALPELTLQRLVRAGQLVPSVPREPLDRRAPFGHWVYLSCTDDDLSARILSELQTRLPHLQAQSVRAERNMFACAGDWPTVGPLGLGFDADVAAAIHRAGLSIVPRPVSYDWHEPALIHHTLAQAAEVGDGVVAFAGDLILGHEMHLNETLAALEAHQLTFAYFAQSRHQRGDWFIAKRRMPNVVIAHQFTPAQMIPEDYHSIAHRWANLARERGVRMLFLNFFRVVHATEPFECLRYIEHVRAAVEEQGFDLADERRRTEVEKRSAVRRPPSAVMGLVLAGAGALAARQLLSLNDAATMALSGVAALGAMMAANRLDRAHDELERQYAPTYASKLLALGAATLSPLAAFAIAHQADDVLKTILADSLIAASSAAALAALTSSDEYRLRVEQYKGFDLDLWLPVALALVSPVHALLALLIGWSITRRVAPDLLARFDAAPATSHTHHLSAAMRALGDVALTLGPRPIRKWAGLAPLGLAVSIAARQQGLRSLETIASVGSVIGHAAALTGFRKPERDPRITARDVARSWLIGSLTGLLAAIAINNLKSEI